MVSKENTGGVLHRRTIFMQVMRRKTLESGSFTTTDIADATDVPRSTAQDWINRLLNEGCIFLKEEQRGRNPARYASRSALPQTTCRRIFTTVYNGYAEIFHECLSSGCAGFCEFHHRKAKGAALRVSRDGLIFREVARIDGALPLDLSRAAVGLESVLKDGDNLVQIIKSVYGGPAYSLSSMMGMAKGVLGVKLSTGDGFVTGKVTTPALIPVTVGIDDTDRKGCGGATFALATALFKALMESGTAIGIRHQVAVLAQDIEEKTAGNSCSFLEFAVYPGKMDEFIARVCRFVEDESVSDDWGVAIFKGIFLPRKIQELAAEIRKRRVIYEDVVKAADYHGIKIYGGRGIIGAVAAVGMKNQPQEVLLDPQIPMVADMRR